MAARMAATRKMTTEPVTRHFPVPMLAARIFTITQKAGFDSRIVGGAVRDWLAGRPIVDIDMAIAAPIHDAADLFRRQGLKVIETGIEHGTVTVVEDGQHLEITQTRVDLETDGRHATVAFSDDWAVDAARRDFTINAVYVDSSGRIEDPLGGCDDLKAGILRFVGDATRRVEEDALRMLRYCRFLPDFGTAGIDDRALAAITDRAGLAATLSGERVATELRRLLSRQGATTAIGLMRDTGLAAAALGVVPEVARLTAEVDRAVEIAAGDECPAWLVRLAVIAPPGTAARLAKRLRLSRRDDNFLLGLDMTDASAEFDSLSGANWQQAVYWLCRAGGVPAATMIVAGARAGCVPDHDHLVRLTGWSPPRFPLQGADLLSQGVDSGPAVGEMLRAAERLWVDRHFTPTRADLLAFLDLGSPA